MSDDFTVLGNDGIRRSFDEHYDTMMDVEQDPTGAMWAIQKQADRIEELEAKLEEAFIVAADLYRLHLRMGPAWDHAGTKEVMESARRCLAELKGQNDE